MTFSVADIEAVRIASDHHRPSDAELIAYLQHRAPRDHPDRREI